MTVEFRSNFATGNGLLLSADEHTITLDRDLRDSVGERWYWHVMLRSAKSPVTVRLARSSLIGIFGPAIDSGGGTYWWLPLTPDSETHFDVPLRPWAWTAICPTLPYGLRELQAFQERLDDEACASWGAVTESEGGRLVPKLTIPSVGDANAVILLTARHHACEAMASYVLEGAVDEFVRLRKQGKPVAGVELTALPMIDVDGVCEGDQGKGRMPWDHGRDYGESTRYRSVSALRALLRNEDRPLYALDLHTPGLRGPLEEVSYVVASGERDSLDQAGALLLALASTEIEVKHTPELLVFDEDWNSRSAVSHRCCSAWLRGRRSTRLALAVEYPNAVYRGKAIYAKDARQYGASLMRALVAIMQ